MAAILGKIISFFRSGLQGGGGEPDLQERISLAIIRLDSLLDKAREIRYRFETRNRELWEKIIQMIQRGEERRAKVYSGELAQVRNILKLIKALELMIEMVKERLQTVRDTKELVRVLMSFGTAVEELKTEAQGLYPGLVYAFDEITRNTRALLIETSADSIPDVDPVTITHEASSILAHAMKEAERRIREKFPEAPIEPVFRVQTQKQYHRYTQHTPTPSIRAQKAAAPYRRTKPPKMTMKELEDRILEYIREHSGFLDLADFTAKHGVSKEEVFRALKKLAEKGLISLT